MLILEAHNTLRSTVALGNGVNKNGSTLPRAGNMYKFTYSRLVESYAQAVADTCEKKHISNNGTSNNLFIQYDSEFWAPGKMLSTKIAHLNLGRALNKSAYSWYAELAKDGQNTLSSPLNHFTEMTWADTKEIGCAIANCTKLIGSTVQGDWLATFVVCNYSPT